MNICIYGSATNRIAEVYREKTFDLAKKMALRGHSLVYGGGRNGVMGACARGAAEGGGKVNGIVPSFFKVTKLEDLNENCTNVVYSTTMHDRKELMEGNSEAFIISPGGIGTFDEFFSILTNKQLGRTSAPIVVFNVDGYYDKLLSFIDDCIEKLFIRPNCTKLFAVFNTAEEVLDYIESNVGKELDITDLKDG